MGGVGGTGGNSGHARVNNWYATVNNPKNACVNKLVYKSGQAGNAPENKWYSTVNKLEFFRKPACTQS